MAIETILNFIADHKDGLGWFFGTGIVVAGAKWGWSYLNRRRELRIPGNTFPFDVIPPRSPEILQLLMGGDEKNPLADFNIPYQIRREGESTRRELEMLLEERRWVVVIGPTGLGKTREAAELAKTYSNEGWTVLKLTDRDWLDVPLKFPTDKVGDRKKLLFFIDNLNSWIYRSREREFAPRATEPFQPLRVHLLERLLRRLEFYEDE